MARNGVWNVVPRRISQDPGWNSPTICHSVLGFPVSDAGVATRAGLREAGLCRFPHPIDLISDSDSAVTKAHLKEVTAGEAFPIICVTSLTGFTHWCRDILREALRAKRSLGVRPLIVEWTLELEIIALEPQLVTQLAVLVFQLRRGV